MSMIYTSSSKIKKMFFNFFFLLTAFSNLFYGQIIENKIYINSETGNNLNLGTKDNPIKSLTEAAKRVNQAKGKGAITIILADGIYGLETTAKFQPMDWQFTQTERLTIRAASLPDDSNWEPSKMPVIISMMPLVKDDYGTTSYGIQLETNHVSIQGLRVLGIPIHEKPAEGTIRRVYPIVREGTNLDDLRISQCLFIGDKNTIPNHLPILVDGQGIEVDHCVFYNVKDAIVFFVSDTLAKNCKMHHNLMINNYGGAIWSWSLAPDFKYYNNVVVNTNIFWILNKDEKIPFNVSNSMVLGYNELIHKGGGALDFGTKSDSNKLVFDEKTIIIKEIKVEIEEDQTKRNYLHVKPNTIGSSLGAGLFIESLK
jgi:hypothetical protein